MQSKPNARFYWFNALPDSILLTADYSSSQVWSNVTISGSRSIVALGVNGGSFVMPMSSDMAKGGDTIIWFAFS